MMNSSVFSSKYKPEEALTAWNKYVENKDVPPYEEDKILRLFAPLISMVLDKKFKLSSTVEEPFVVKSDVLYFFYKRIKRIPYRFCNLSSFHGYFNLVVFGIGIDVVRRHKRFFDTSGYNDLAPHYKLFLGKDKTNEDIESVIYIKEVFDFVKTVSLSEVRFGGRAGLACRAIINELLSLDGINTKRMMNRAMLLGDYEKKDVQRLVDYSKTVIRIVTKDLLENGYI